MNRKRIFSVIALMAALAWLAASSPTDAQDVSARISTREAYVGTPVVLQLQISNASDYELPEIPEIDGCTVRAAGAPSQSSQITIINGRHSESRSITMQYLITPRRAGIFEIPALNVKVDGKVRTLSPQKFVATKSETGDLMFVEIEGGDQKVFVGQPLDLKLKIWLKPYRERQQQIVLKEGQMWQLVSGQSSWGSFSDRMKELAENNQRPGGKEVLRDDGQGNQRGYYLYEIDATIYPTRPGKIDASDIQIVVQYPTALGRSRDPFDSFFEDSPFGGRSLIKQMMDDDFFRSPFGRGLTVSSARPIVAEVKTDATEVLPVPTEGRPADYRGAVGRYRIVAEAEPTTVDAGDPITLRLGIVGNGPMELVQAPPLAEIESLTEGFKVADQSLAGFVRDETKVFVTTIRPRRDGISEIPPIPFSFFDPESESFDTVYSQPIAITVNKAETLSLDSIVSNARGGRAKQDDAADGENIAAADILVPDLQNSSSRDLLVSQTPSSGVAAFWLFVLVPPMAWLSLVCVKSLISLSMFIPSFRSAKAACLSAVVAAGDKNELVAALTRFIAARTGQKCESPQQALGALRTCGLISAANEVESTFDRLQRTDVISGADSATSFEEENEACIALIEKLESAFAATDKTTIRRARRGTTPSGRSDNFRKSQIAGLTMLMLTQMTSIASAGTAAQDNRILTTSQQHSILQEADELYQKAQMASATDKAEASELFTAASDKYQLLVDSGIANSGLHVNLGNAQLQTGQLGKAVASYRRALRLDPSNGQAVKNLEFAESKVVSPGVEYSAPEFSFNSWSDIWTSIKWFNGQTVRLVGLTTIKVALAIASVVFWGLVILRTAGRRFRLWRYAVVPLLVLMISGFSFGLQYQPSSDSTGILVVDTTELRQSDGNEFPVLHTLQSVEGREVKIISQRGDWVQVETEPGVNGWLPKSVVEQI